MLLHGFCLPERRAEKSRGGYVTGGAEGNAAGVKSGVLGKVMPRLRKVFINRVACAEMGLVGDSDAQGLPVRSFACSIAARVRALVVGARSACMLGAVAGIL
jgi:hypothetical protein